MHLGELSVFVTSSKDGDSLRVAHLEGEKEGHGLNRVVSFVDVVSHEEVVGLWWLSSNLEELTEIVELSMDVSADGNWCLHLMHVGFIDQDATSLF